jgi:hypothetical protein
MSTLLERSWPRAEPTRVAIVAAAAILVFSASWGVLHRGFYGSDQIVDTPVYQKYGEAMVAGQVPYRDFAVEYPPGALPLFVLPSLGQEHRLEPDYRRRFEWLMLVFGWAMLLGMAVALAGLGVATPWIAAALGFAALAPLALGPVILTRFDLVPAALTAAALAAFVWQRWRLGFGVLAVATVVKVFPGVILPLAVAHVWRHRGRREAVVGTAVFAAVLAAVLVPFVLGTPRGLWDTFRVQADRPLQIESLGAAILVAAHHLGGLAITMAPGSGSENLVGGTPDAVARAQSILQVAVLAALWIWFARRRRTTGEFLAASAAAVCAFLALGRVLSPQFMIWLLPLVPLVRGRRGLLASALLAAALVLTQLWFPKRYWEYAYDFAAFQSWTVLARDVVLLAIVLVLVCPVPSRVRGAFSRERVAPRTT